MSLAELVLELGQGWLLTATSRFKGGKHTRCLTLDVRVSGYLDSLCSV